MKLYISPIKPHMELNGSEHVAAARRERIRKYRRVEDKARCLVAGLLLKQVCGVTDDGHLTYGPNGKPYLKNGGMFFNLSHSGDYVTLATADREVGVDIEKVAPYSQAVAERCFTPEELKWMRRRGDDEAFYRLWTAKESVMKAVGLGLSMPPESFSVLPMDESEHRIGGRSWFLDWTAHDGHVICRAVERGASHFRN